MRACTRQPKSKHKANSGSIVGAPVVHTPARKIPRRQDDCASVVSTPSGISLQDIDAAGPRCCGGLDELIKHMKSVQRIPGQRKRICYVCNKEAVHMCTTYKEDKTSKVASCGGVPLHFNTPKPNETLKVPCFFQYHNTNFFGKATSDFKALNKRKCDMQLPDTQEQEKRSEEINQLKPSAR